MFDFCEVFSPPRLSARARNKGLRGGWSIDLKVADPVTGQKWDLRCPRQVSRLKWRMRRDRPRCITLSPPCTALSSLQELSGGPTKEAWDEAVLLCTVAIDLCVLQHRLGGVFVLENPRTSKGWDLKHMMELLKVDGLLRVNCDMCAHGLTSWSSEGVEGPAKKPTSFWTIPNLWPRCSIMSARA